MKSSFGRSPAAFRRADAAAAGIRPGCGADPLHRGRISDDHMDCSDGGLPGRGAGAGFPDAAEKEIALLPVLSNRSTGSFW